MFKSYLCNAIRYKKTNQDEGQSKDRAPLCKFTISVQAYVNNSLLEIEFEHPSNDVTILIINSTTGETVYYEKTTSFEKIKFINLDKHYKTTEYTLKVSSPLWVAVGVISIE